MDPYQTGRTMIIIEVNQIDATSAPTTAPTIDPTQQPTGYPTTADCATEIDCILAEECQEEAACTANPFCKFVNGCTTDCGNLCNENLCDLYTEPGGPCVRDPLCEEVNADCWTDCGADCLQNNCDVDADRCDAAYDCAFDRITVGGTCFVISASAAQQQQYNKLGQIIGHEMNKQEEQEQEQGDGAQVESLTVSLKKTTLINLWLINATCCICTGILMCYVAYRRKQQQRLQRIPLTV